MHGCKNSFTVHIIWNCNRLFCLRFSWLKILFLCSVVLGFFWVGWVGGGGGVVVFGGGESVEQKQNVYQSFKKKKKKIVLLAYLKIYNVMHPVSIRTMCCDGVRHAVTCTEVYHSVRYLTLWPFLNLTWGIALSAGCLETRGEGVGMMGGGGLCQILKSSMHDDWKGAVRVECEDETALHCCFFCRRLMAVKVFFCFVFFFMSVGKFVMIKISYCAFLCGEVATVKTSFSVAGS